MCQGVPLLMARTIPERKQGVLATEAAAPTARKVRARKGWWLCEESQQTEEDNPINFIEGQEDSDELVSLPLSAMVVGEDRGLEYGGLGEEDEIEGNVDALSRVAGHALVHVFVYIHHTSSVVIYKFTITRVHQGFIPVPFTPPCSFPLSILPSLSTSRPMPEPAVSPCCSGHVPVLPLL
jgi:hypothetical protein